MDICGDGIDQDCDGVADEGCSCTADDSRPCGTDNGLCNAGTQYCDSGAWSSTCSGAVMPTLDTCNGQDEDCDGVIDNDSDAVALPASSPCYDGVLDELDAPVTTCKEGLRYCWNGTEDNQRCIGQVVPVFDKCGDQLNTDCDAEFEEECL